jgi:hypothetical protein
VRQRSGIEVTAGPSPENHHVPSLLTLRIGEADSALALFEAGCLSEHALTFFHP